MGTASAPVLDYPSPLAEINLCLLSWLTLHPPEWQGIGLFQLPHKTLHRIVAANEFLLAHQVLVNTLSGQAGVQTGFDEPLKRLAVTDSARLEPGGRNGWVCSFDRLRPGGRNGWVWLLHLASHSTVSSHGLAVDPQFASYPA